MTPAQELTDALEHMAKIENEIEDILKAAGKRNLIEDLLFAKVRFNKAFRKFKQSKV